MVVAVTVTDCLPLVQGYRLRLRSRSRLAILENISFHSLTILCYLILFAFINGRFLITYYLDNVKLGSLIRKELRKISELIFCCFVLVLIIFIVIFFIKKNDNENEKEKDNENKIKSNFFCKSLLVNEWNLTLSK